MDRDDFFYINWMRDATLKNITSGDFSEKFEWLEKNGIEKKGAKTVKMEWFATAGDHGTAYQVERINNYLRLLTFSFENGYVIYSTNTFDESKNEIKDKEYKPTVAFSKFREAFAKNHGSKDPKFFGRVFGSSPEAFLFTILKPIYYVNPFWIGKKLKSCGSIDRSSAYPADACGPLPDANTAIIREGYAEPTAEYPFAFYMKSGHIAEYGRFNSREWLDLPFDLNIFRFKDGREKPSYFIPKEEDETVLMKSAKYTLDDLWEKYYQKKEGSGSPLERKFAKAVLVSIIGCWHMTNTIRKYQYKYAHLAAITIARANAECLRKMEEIGFSRCIHVVVDGIAYAGEEEEGQSKKELGKWVDEAVNCEGLFKGMNFYLIKKGDEVVKERHGGFNFFEDGTPIKEKSIKNFEDLDKLERI